MNEGEGCFLALILLAMAALGGFVLYGAVGDANRYHTEVCALRFKSAPRLADTVAVVRADEYCWKLIRGPASLRREQT